MKPWDKLINIIRMPYVTVLLLLVIIIPSVFSMLNPFYFNMHDEQHIARLFLLDTAIKQGIFYPRWVDQLGFGFGYPLFNFYPPLIYYIAEIFHLLGFSFISSIKLLIATGFFLSALSLYFLAKEFQGKIAAFLSVTLYIYFFYHSITAYVRGALAEFFTFAIIPVVFLAIYKLSKNINIKWSLLLGISFSLLILNHPLIAFPSIFFIAFFLIYSLFNSQNKYSFLKYNMLGFLIGLGLSAFFWLPSLVEKQYTLVDSILTKELADYKIHFVYLQQLWYSPWGFGGSIKGPYDGFTFQLGKIHIFLYGISILLSFFYFRKYKFNSHFGLFVFLNGLFLFSLLMVTEYSSFIWDHIHFLAYLQFPWRFLTFTNVFLSIICGYAIFFFQSLFKTKNHYIHVAVTLLLVLIIIIKYHSYFKPQTFFATNDTKLTSYDEIAWRISETSFEFSPKGVATKLSSMGTTKFDITKETINRQIYEATLNTNIRVIENKFNYKLFYINAIRPFTFQLQTFNFPGWAVYIEKDKINEKQLIDDNNKFKLITINAPAGNYILRFQFEETPIRKTADILSFLTLMGIVIYFIRQFYITRLKK